MLTERDLAAVDRALARYRAGRIDRRRLLRTLGALGVSTAAGARVLATGAAASEEVAAHAHGAPAAQEGAPVATPELGERADGSRVWKVIAGGGDPAQLIDSVAFLPGEITINAGDAVFFENRGFHNVHFLSGAALPPLVVPDPAGGTPSAAGPTLILNPEVVFPSGGTTYDGTGVVNSGAPLDPTAPPFVLTFSTPGAYDYYCTIHGEVMAGRVVVQEAGAAYPLEQAEIDRMAEEELAALVELGRAGIERYGAATPVAGTGGTVHEVTAGFVEGQIDVLRFLPGQISVKAGDTVRWTVRSAPVTPHIVTFLGGEEPPEFLTPEMGAAGPPKFVLNPRLVAPAGGTAFAADEYLNSGLLGGPDGQVSYELTFDVPGIHRYYCPIHGDPEGGMIGDIVVE